MAAMASPLGGYEQIRSSFVRALAKTERFFKAALGIEVDDPSMGAVQRRAPGVVNMIPPWDEYSLAKSHAEVEYLLNKGLNTRPPTPEAEGGNPLSQVMCNLPAGERAAGVKAMLTKGNANAVHNYGVGLLPVQIASHLGDPGVIGALMDHGATFGKSAFFALQQGAMHRLDVARQSGADRGEWTRIMGGMKECLSEAFKRMGEGATKDLLRDPDIQSFMDRSPILRETIHKAQQVFDDRDWTQKTKVGISLSGQKLG